MSKPKGKEVPESTKKIEVGLTVYIKCLILGLFVFAIFFSIFRLLTENSFFTLKQGGKIIFTAIVSALLIYFFLAILKSGKEKPTEDKEGDRPTNKKEKALPKTKEETSWLGWVVIIFLILISFFLLWKHWNPFWNQVSTRWVVNGDQAKNIQCTTPNTQVQNWKMYWKKPDNVAGINPEKRSASFNIKFTRLDEDMMEFLVISNVKPKSQWIRNNLKKQQSGNWHWEGTYTSSYIENSGYIRLNERMVNGHLEYVGEQSVDETCAEWVYTVLRPD